MDVNQTCDKKRRLFYYKSNPVRGSHESKFIKFITKGECDKYDDNHDYLLSLKDYFNCRTDDSENLLGGTKLNTKKRKYTKKRKSNKIKKRKNKRNFKRSCKKLK